MDLLWIRARDLKVCDSPFLDYPTERPISKAKGHDSILWRLTTSDVCTPWAGNTFTYCLLTTSRWSTCVNSTRNNLSTWLRTQTLREKRQPCSEDTKTKTLSSPYQASAQVLMHKVLPGDLGPRLSEVKVQKSWSHACCTNGKIPYCFFIQGKIILLDKEMS